MNDLSFTTKDACVYRGLAQADTYVMTGHDVEEKAHGGVYVRTDMLTGISWASWRDLLGKNRWHSIAIDTPLCGGCDCPVLAGPCDCGVE